MAELTQRGIAELIPLKNALHFHHGQRWALGSEAEPGDDETMQVISAEHQVSREHLLNHRLELLPEFIQAFATQLSSSAKRMAFEVAGRAADESGNTIIAAEHASVAEALLETIRRARITVAEDGTLSIPSMYIHPDNAKQFLSQLRSQPPAFGRRVREEQARQKIAALEEELERLRRFSVLREGAESGAGSGEE